MLDDCHNLKNLDPLLGLSELQSLDTSQMKETDLKVYKAIIILFESKDDIDIFNKKAIYNTHVTFIISLL